MKSLLKFIALLFIITLIPITDTHAIVAAVPHAVNSDVSNNLGRKLTWRERIALKVLKWQVGKTIQGYGVSDTTPSVSCSKIVLKNGKTIEANISQISKTEVKYRRCGFPSDPEMIESKDDISVVLASDGGTLFVNDGMRDARASTQAITQDILVTESNAKQAIGLSGLAWLDAMLASTMPIFAILAIVCAICAIIYGIRSLAKINKEPQKYKGKGLAVAGIILAGLLLFLVIIGTAAILA